MSARRPPLTPPRPLSPSRCRSAGTVAASSTERHDEVPLTPMRRAIARRLTESKIDGAALLRRRGLPRRPAARAAPRGQRELTRAQGLGERLRAQGGRAAPARRARRPTRSGPTTVIRRYHDVDIAVAVASTTDCVTPVVRDVHGSSSVEVSAQSATSRSAPARDGCSSTSSRAARSPSRTSACTAWTSSPRSSTRRRPAILAVGAARLRRSSRTTAARGRHGDDSDALGRPPRDRRCGRRAAGSPRSSAADREPAAHAGLSAGR